MPVNGILGSAGTEEQVMIQLILGLLLSAVIGYFIGSLNSGIIISKIKYKDDIRLYGSKNAGMTNMLRVYGKGAALATLLGDVGKAVVCALIGRLLLGDSGAYCAGLFCILGHVFPIYYKFKGGKGVLTFAVLVLMLNPLVFLILFTIFVLIVSFTKFISLGSVICALLYPIVLSRFSEPNAFVIIPSVLIALLIVWLHRANISRLLAGEESKFSLSRKKEGGKPFPKWILVLINAVLIGSLVATFLIMSFAGNGGFDRRAVAAESDNVTLSRLQLRYLYIDTVRTWFADPENQSGEIVKNYDPKKPLYQQNTPEGETYADYFMRLTCERASLLLYRISAATKAGYTTISGAGQDAIAEELAALKRTLNEGETYLTFEQYLTRTYGVGMQQDDWLDVKILEVRAEEYFSSLSPDAASDLLPGGGATTVKFQESAVKKVMKTEFTVDVTPAGN